MKVKITNFFPDGFKKSLALVSAAIIVGSIGQSFLEPSAHKKDYSVAEGSETNQEEKIVLKIQAVNANSIQTENIKVMVIDTDKNLIAGFVYIYPDGTISPNEELELYPGRNYLVIVDDGVINHEKSFTISDDGTPCILNVNCDSLTAEKLNILTK